MKNSKKLIIASLMLVFAFVAVVSSTFAWFTMQQQAEVEEITLNVGAAGKDLQISTDGNDYGYSITLGEVTGKLTPVTFDDSDDKFKALTFDATDTFFVYEDALVVKPGDTLTNEGYLEYDLFFKSSEAISVNLDLLNSTILSANTSALGSLRLMFIEVNETDAEVVATRKIWEPANATATGTFGTGNFYDPTKNYIAYNAYTNGTESTADDFLLNATSSEDFKLNPEFFTADKIYSVDAPVDNKLIVTTLTAGVAKQIRVKIWIEGWDGDANNTAAEAELKTFLSFIGE